MAFLELRNVSKAYGEGAERTEVLANVSLEIERGEFVAIVGFSGSGKTTLISLIAGLIEPDEGEILIDGKRIAGPGPERGVIFQNYSLLPWLTVYGNVALVVNHLFPAWPAKKRRAHVERYVEMVHLTPALQKRPVALFRGYAPAGGRCARLGDGPGDFADGRAAQRPRCADAGHLAGRD